MFLYNKYIKAIEREKKIFSYANIFNEAKMQ